MAFEGEFRLLFNWGYQLHGHIHARMEYNEANRAEGIRKFPVDR